MKTLRADEGAAVGEGRPEPNVAATRGHRWKGECLGCGPRLPKMVAFEGRGNGHLTTQFVKFYWGARFFDTKCQEATTLMPFTTHFRDLRSFASALWVLHLRAVVPDFFNAKFAGARLAESWSSGADGRDPQWKHGHSRSSATRGRKSAWRLRCTVCFLSLFLANLVLDAEVFCGKRHLPQEYHVWWNTIVHCITWVFGDICFGNVDMLDPNSLLSTCAPQLRGVIQSKNSLKESMLSKAVDSGNVGLFKAVEKCARRVLSRHEVGHKGVL